MSATTQITAAGTGSSVVVERCQVCESPDLRPILFLGYLPPVNQMRAIGSAPEEQPSYPALLLLCARCRLLQLGLIVDPAILFPPDYPYTSGTTQILRDNFAELCAECQTIAPLTSDDLILDIGSNDGTLLQNFRKIGCRVLGVEPSRVGELARTRGIETISEFFTREVALKARTNHGPAKIVTATNVFAHIEHIHEVVENILLLLDQNGIFVSESHYCLSLVETLQYDTIYHEHLRYYSLQSLQQLLQLHGLQVIHAKRIPTHGGSIRVYAARTGRFPVRDTVDALLKQESTGLTDTALDDFRRKTVLSKLQLHSLLLGIKRQGQKVYGIAAPSRATTLINYIGLDQGIMECVVETAGSLKIGKYIPGTLIPVLEESKLYQDQPEYVLILAWHIAEELIPKLEAKGYRGRFIVPLPEPRLLPSSAER